MRLNVFRCQNGRFWQIGSERDPGVRRVEGHWAQPRTEAEVRALYGDYELRKENGLDRVIPLTR